MPDVKDFERLNPTHERSEVAIMYSTLEFKGCLEDEYEDVYDYKFMGSYWYHDSMFRIVAAIVYLDRPLSTITLLELQNMIEYDIRSELRVSIRESIIFETQIELK